MCKTPFSVQRLKLPFFSGNHDQLKHGFCVATSYLHVEPGAEMCLTPVLGFLRRCSPYLQDSVVIHGGGSLHAAWAVSPRPRPQCVCPAQLGFWPHIRPQSEALSLAACLPVIWEAQVTSAAPAPSCTTVSTLASSSSWERGFPAWPGAAALAHSEGGAWLGGYCGFHQQQMQALSAFASRHRLARTDPGPPWLRVVWPHLSAFWALPELHLVLVACRVTSFATLFCLGCRKHLEETQIHSLMPQSNRFVNVDRLNYVLKKF